MHTIHRLLILSLALLMAFAFFGCQSSDNAELQSQIDELRSQLGDANSRIQEMEQERDQEAEAPSSTQDETELFEEKSPESSGLDNPQPESSSEPNANESAAADGSNVIDLSSNGQTSMTSSSSFTAGAGQTLTLEVKSSIQGGKVDFFLFSPSNQEQQFTFYGDDTQTIELTAGTWAYNCTGFFESGDITIIGTLH